ncbi:hypothetical protein DICPUDRAFT_34423 [Dictyostelium purpureum]|uniref:Glutathione S-transferase n=1 Tax=Dictyostelium purpureum TaxID=5786 RepID=F0ZMP7_DICPU|nr:uncharacterized protein DICPUDRAFT_34423 [Dictyostelium purpureum]EGC34770.1 hypothetical protein DICPUDRAFT_34423 [Dictyostelium purpureum]|eukprot:XP_003288685.1 hypothetical protein DICPUDRAFT_34423 [Dictyostelium purpureum]
MTENNNIENNSIENNSVENHDLDNNNNTNNNSNKDNIPSLTYFNSRGLAQFIRVLHAYLNIPYNNIVIDTIDDVLRVQLPYSQLPIYRDGPDFILAQSSVIAKYVAAKHNFLGKSIQEQYKIDEVVTLIVADLFGILQTIRKGIDKVFGSLENKYNKSKFLVGDDYSLADLYAYVSFDYTIFLGKISASEASEKFVKLEENKNHFESNPGVIEYIKNRPDTKF